MNNLYKNDRNYLKNDSNINSNYYRIRSKFICCISLFWKKTTIHLFMAD